MKTFKKYIIVLLVVIFTHNFNIAILANKIDYIKLGIVKSKSVDEIHINNQDILVGYSVNDNFFEKVSLNSNYGFTVKILDGYFIKISNVFQSYDDALAFSFNKENFFPILENDSWRVYIKGFNSALDAQSFIASKNIVGEVLNKEIVTIFSKDNILLAYENEHPLQFKNNSSRISLNNKLYRNIIEILVKDKKLTAINYLDVEQYLYGVVPAEMPSSWPIEALKAQAVAARNYSYRNFSNHKNDGFNLCDTTHCQVYNGVAGEKDTTNKAVDDTKGLLAYFKDEIINAVYYSSNGGNSENSENVWNYKVDYLRGIKDNQEKGAKVWERVFSFEEISSLANIGNINKIELEHSPDTNRVSTLTLYGTLGEKVLKKEEIRTFFTKSKNGALESRNFVLKNLSSSIKKIDENNIYVFNNTTSNKIDLKNCYIIDDKEKVSLNNTNYILDLNGDKIYFNAESFNNASNMQSNTPIITSITKDMSSQITFLGKGWGHGVGMSQYGAKSLAENGYKFDEILKYYYTQRIDIK